MEWLLAFATANPEITIAVGTLAVTMIGDALGHFIPGKYQSQYKKVGTVVVEQVKKKITKK